MVPPRRSVDRPSPAGPMRHQIELVSAPGWRGEQGPTGWGGKRRERMLPLDGIRVVDLSRALAGPYCTMMMGDLGADVVKVEMPGTGDDSRHWGPPFEGGESSYYLSCNRNKRGVAFDLKSAAGLEALW